MRVSIVNCVSTAADMMAFSDESLLNNAGYADWDYVVVKWRSSQRVNEYLDKLGNRLTGASSGIKLTVLEHRTDSRIGYVPNLRAMMNKGFDHGFSLNEYCGLVNTDCVFGPAWLQLLVKYASPERCINSMHVTRATPPKPVKGIITEDLGMPLPGKFNSDRFIDICSELYHDELWTAPTDDYRQAATMPYLFHWQWWHRCGPWELETTHGTPDVRFFDRMAQAGAEFCLSRASVAYHAEAVERRGTRPSGTEHLREE